MLVRCRVELAPWTYPHPEHGAFPLLHEKYGRGGLAVGGYWLLVNGGWWLVAEKERSVGLGDGALELRSPHQRFVPYPPTINNQQPPTNHQPPGRIPFST